MRSSVVTRVAGLGVLTAAGQLLIIGSLPAYSRMFDPGTYGEYVIFVGAFAVVSVLAGLRYDSAIVLPRSQRMARTLSMLVILLGLAVALLIALATMTAATLALAPERWGSAERQFGYGLAAATVIGALQRCLVAWCVRDSRYLLMGSAQFAFCLVTVVAQLSFATVMEQLPALIWGYVGALGFQTLCLMRSGSRRQWGMRMGVNPIRRMRVAAHRYRRFPTYMVGYALASSARDRLIQLVLGLGMGAAIVGRFGLAYRVVFAPNSLVYSAVSPVFFGFASRGSKGSVGHFAAALVEAIFVVLVVPYVAFALEAPALTDAVLSEKWHGTGPYLQALAAPALLLAATCWLDRAFDSFGRQNVAFSLEASFTVASVTLVACLPRFIEPIFVVWAFAALALGYYWIYFLCTFVACDFPLVDFRRVCTTGVLALATTLICGTFAHHILTLAWRVPAYAVVMAGVIVLWLKLRNGVYTIRTLVAASVNSDSR